MPLGAVDIRYDLRSQMMSWSVVADEASQAEAVGASLAATVHATFLALVGRCRTVAVLLVSDPRGFRCRYRSGLPKGAPFL